MCPSSTLFYKQSVLNWQKNSASIGLFKRRHNIDCERINGEANNVNQDIVKEWGNTNSHFSSKGIKLRTSIMRTRNWSFFSSEYLFISVKGDTRDGCKTSKDTLTICWCVVEHGSRNQKAFCPS